MLTRIAPTPSGYIHTGNAVNFLLTSWWATDLDLEVALRIDDADTTRVRNEYLTDVFRVLDALGITWQVGPASADEQRREHSQQSLTAYFRAELMDAVERGLPVFRCGCSRSTLATTLGCECRDQQHRIESDAPLRLDLQSLDSPHMAQLDRTELDGTVLWRRDGLPAYHLVNVVTDRDLGTTHIVRGEDLRGASRLHRFLAPFFGADLLAESRIVHHRLLTDAHGRKLSKSSGRQGRPLSLAAREIDEIVDMAQELGAPVGITPPW